MCHYALDAGTEMHTGAGEFLKHDSLAPKISSAAAIAFGRVAKQKPGPAGINPRLGIGTGLLPPAALLR